MYNIPPKTSRKKAPGARLIYRSFITNIATHPMAMYMAEDSFLGIFIHSIFMVIPKTAMTHRIINTGMPVLFGSTYRQKGEYDPAIRI